MGSIEFRIKEVKRDVHVIPIADKTLQSNTKARSKVEKLTS